ncbi:response regulator [Scleromatobacter humisilvae]|uniref:histidine kinase n=1 Tax=Scleromatobacter humisilvae TaxID=2897159 RepID=A0A9X2C202_9BURK|nr:response regulator [Scleromatobacter humisilvae]MCK9686284.1 response regulator [Scleromatobacter humisilvae]
MSSDPTSPHGAHDDVFIGDSDTARLMRAHDWASTPLGPVSGWASSLKVALGLLLTSRFEMWLGWGDDIHFFYNDAYRPTLGSKHPQSLGQPIRLIYPEIWDDIKDRLHSVYHDGASTWDRALLLLINRRGFPEETYHTFSYSPLRGDSGRVEGIFCAVTEETERVISERRLASLGALATNLTGAEGEPEVLRAAARALGSNGRDLPFTVTYLFDADGAAHVAGMTNVPEGSELARRAVATRDALWDVGTIWRDAQAIEVDLVPQLGYPMGAWAIPPARAAIVPIVGQGSEHPVGALLVGLNPYRPGDADYLSYLGLLAGQLSSSLAGARVYDAERRRAQTLAEAVALREAAADALAQANLQLTSEVALRTQERDRMQRLFEQSPSFMALLAGREHRFEFANNAYLQLIGHREVVGLAVREALPEVEGQGFFELLDNCFDSATPFVGTNMKVQLQRARAAALEERFINLVYQPIVNADGAVEGLFVNGFDVTHQHRAESALQALNETLEQRVTLRTTELADALRKLQHESGEREAAQAALRQAQRMESLGQLTGGVAHDFNNLLQVISGNLQLLRREVAGNERAEKRVQSAIGGVTRGAKLASQLLAFGRRQPLEPKVLNIGRFIKGMDDMLRRALGEEIELETVISGGLWNALVDPGQIENAILNLGINARDAMPDGGKLTIEAGNAMLDDEYCRLHEDLQPGQYVMVGVTDTGSGIAPELLERVFEPFFSTKPEGKGTGLGLSMVYGFVKQSGGHVKIYSELGQGTTIRIYLPRVHQSEDALADETAAPVRGGSETVLVVEDDDEVRETAVGLLTDLGYRVLKAREAMGALSIIESGMPIDVLFTDVVMPGPLRSPELARKAKERLPGLAVLFTSGYTENAIVHGGRLDRGVELLSKPYTREALARKIRHVLANQAQQRVLVETSAPAPMPLPVARVGTVLLVEDDEFIRETLAELLGVSGHVVLQAHDAASALAALEARPVDVLVTDIGLPRVSGIDLARDAIARQPRLAVIFATGDPGAPARAGIEAAAVLVKPFSPEDLESAVANALNGERR